IGPSVRLGTNRPSITSTWIQSAPPASARCIASARWPKSAFRIDGAILINRLSLWERPRVARVRVAYELTTYELITHPHPRPLPEGEGVRARAASSPIGEADRRRPGCRDPG